MTILAQSAPEINGQTSKQVGNKKLSKFGQAALVYAARGWRVHPLYNLTEAGCCSCPKGHECDNKPGKHPRLKAWQKKATSDAGQIEHWWTQWPQANIGIMGGNGLLFIDGDIHDPEKNGLENLERLQAIYGPLPDTLMARSGSDGIHRYYVLPNGVEIASKGLNKFPGLEQFTGIDIKSAGGYVLAPPSFAHKDGHPYQWVNEGAELAVFPQGYIDLLREVPKDAISADQEWRQDREQGSVIAAYNRAYKITDVLKNNGYIRNEDGRYTRPEGKSASVVIIDGTHSYHWSTNDDLCDGHTHTAFSAFCKLEHEDNVKKAVKEAARLLGISKGDEAERDQADEGQAETKPIPEFACTDVGNSDRLAYWHGKNIRYCHEWGHWLLWNKKRWVKDSQNQIERLAIKTARAIYREAEQASDEKREKELVRHALRSQHDQRIKAMVRLAQSALPITPGELDSSPWLFNAKNGTIDLQTGMLRPHRREDYLTRTLDVDYTPGATCPTWQRFLEIALPDAEIRRFLHLAFGYTLTGITNEQCLFFLYGEGSNGKSTLCAILWALLAGHAEKNRAEAVMTHRFTQASAASPEIAKLAGARLLQISEIQDGQRLNEALIKDLTGDLDVITARFLHKNEFSFKPAFKVWMYGNHKPAIRGNDDGIWRRVRLVPFTQRFAGPADKPKTGDLPKDKDLPNKLMAEMPGILAWTVQGCLAWQQEGLPTPKAVTQATEAYREEMDALKPFFDECCFLSTRAQVSKADLWHAYQAWAGLVGDQAYETQRKFNEVIKKHAGISADRTTGGLHIWRGIGLSVSGEPDDGLTRQKVTEVIEVTDSSRLSQQVTPLREMHLNNSVTLDTSVTLGRELLNAGPNTAGTAALDPTHAPLAVVEERGDLAEPISIEEAREQRASPTPVAAAPEVAEKSIWSQSAEELLATLKREVEAIDYDEVRDHGYPLGGNELVWGKVFEHNEGKSERLRTFIQAVRAHVWEKAQSQPPRK